MKRLVISLLLSLALVSGALASQNKNAKPPAKAAPAKAAPAKAAPAPMDDASITTAVKDKLSKTPSLKNTSINVSTSNGVVTLTGVAKTGGLKGVATNAAKRVKGVKKVDNQMTVEAKPAPNKNAAAKTPPKKPGNKNSK